jgi:hypothetical protein
MLELAHTAGSNATPVFVFLGSSLVVPKIHGSGINLAVMGTGRPTRYSAR